MNQFYKSFIESGFELAKDHDVKWEMFLRPDGSVTRKNIWNLTKITNSPSPPTYCIRDLGSDNRTLEILNIQRQQKRLPLYEKKPLSSAWLDFIKAAVLNQLFLRKFAANHVLTQICRPLRVLATCTSHEPWELLAEDITLALGIANTLQASGHLAQCINVVTRSIIDTYHIADIGPLYPALSSISKERKNGHHSRHTYSGDRFQPSLETIKKTQSLPEHQAFLELVRIVFTEQPRTFMDHLRFAQVKIMLLCGMQTADISLLPEDWKRRQDFYTPSGQLAGEHGGYSQALFLQHFFEKHHAGNSGGTALYEARKYVPAIFEQDVVQTLDKIARLTQPLRQTLRRQMEENRILPWFHQGELVLAIKLYPYLTGNPILISGSPDEHEFPSRYQQSLDPGLFNKLHKTQLAMAGTARLNMSLYVYFNRMKGKVTFRKSDGTPWHGLRMKWDEVFLRIDEVENYLARESATKHSSLTSLPTSTGKLEPWKLMFLMPIRALIETRNEGLCDITRYFAVGRMDSRMVQHSLSGNQSGVQSLFEAYGRTDEDRSLALNAHSLKHLQITDSFYPKIIRMVLLQKLHPHNLKHIHENHPYAFVDRREQINLPSGAEKIMGEKVLAVAKLIKAGKADNPIVQTFKKIQKTQGEAVALAFLGTEANGFHATPYGYCITSLTSEPCPKYLECFANCRHLAASNLSENGHHLTTLKNRFEKALVDALNRPAESIGRENQIMHIKERLGAVQTLLASVNMDSTILKQPPPACSEFQF
ncbi:MAG TPA: hypothetical protein VND43_03315 [Burkholderiales bacterium]|nr:hypothetical protein [Burkholderiales bacterium]